MRLRGQVIGALNLFRAGSGPFGRSDLRVGQALADVATIGLLQERNLRRSETIAEQLQAALNSRIIIEQAKGKLAERYNLTMDQAFTLLRDHARQTNQRLTDTARELVDSAMADLPPQPGNQSPRPEGPASAGRRIRP
jgi:hypothetical protein